MADQREENKRPGEIRDGTYVRDDAVSLCYVVHNGDEILSENVLSLGPKKDL